MISEETITKLAELLTESNRLYLKKEELSELIKNESGAETVRLLSIDSDSYNIYLRYTSEKEDIKDIAKQLGYILERTFKNNGTYIYVLTVN